ncbi:MAG TPA: plasmid pRiA4b ORF-3 family protein [Acetobacteraceae bacterium]|nr:plasmid pRiA4b ORF-3 family protein [Acetobacteraceae bacterium]
MRQTRKPRSTGPHAGATTGFESYNEICTIRIELLETNPLIWREVEVPTSITLKVLHDIIQITVGWFDYHLWRFTIGARSYGPPMPENRGDAAPRDATKVRLRDVLEPGTTVIDYLYDFGDSWEHRLTVTDIRQGDPGVSYPRYVGGEWAGPPEDCGGIPGFYATLDALADPKHPEHADVVEWLDEYDPKHIDELPLKFALLRIANRRNAARTRLDKKTA